MIDRMPFFIVIHLIMKSEGMYQVLFTKEDHTRLRDTLANIQGKFLLSYKRL